MTITTKLLAAGLLATAAWAIPLQGNTEKFRAADSAAGKINDLVLLTVAFSDFFQCVL